jgi:pyruvate,water dikinase
MLTAVALASDEIDAAYARLTAHGGAEPPVAVRSSATAEDGEAASFAGAQDTHLWIRGAADVRRHVVRCWASLFTPAAISYRARLGLGHVGHAMAVVVQEMVDAQSAGVMFSLDPLTGDPSQITIESTFGLGLPLVGGEITPDRFCLDKITFEIRSRAIAVKPFADRLVDGRIQRVALDDETGRSSSLSDGEALTLARVARQVEQARQGSVDMEWAIGPGPSGARHVYLLQARPETVWSGSSESSSIATTPASTASGALGRIALGLRRTSP